MGTDQVNLSAIAAEVGVSSTTVHRALNDKDEVSPGTRQRVLAAAERLGYRPNRLARAMVISKTGTIGAVVPHLAGCWTADLAEGIQDAAYELDLSVLLGCSYGDPVRERRLVDRFLESRVDGILVVPTPDPDAVLYGSLLEKGVRIVFLVTSPGSADADRVATDNFRGGYMVGQHLAGLGRRRFAYISPPPAFQDSEERLHGFAAAARDYGLAPPGLVEVRPPPRYGSRRR